MSCARQYPFLLIRRSQAFREAPRILTLTTLHLSICIGVWCSDEPLAAVQRVPRVLVLYSQRSGLPICEQWGRGIHEGLESNLGQQFVIESAYLDFDRLQPLDQRQALLNLVLARYQTIKPDIIIPVQDGIAQLFAGQNPFPNAAVVFCSILEGTRQQNVRYEYWTELSVDTLTERVSKLPQGHVFIFNSYLRDSESVPEQGTSIQVRIPLENPL